MGRSQISQERRQSKVPGMGTAESTLRDPWVCVLLASGGLAVLVSCIQCNTLNFGEWGTNNTKLIGNSQSGQDHRELFLKLETVCPALRKWLNKYLHTSRGTIQELST